MIYWAFVCFNKLFETGNYLLDIKLKLNFHKTFSLGHLLTGLLIYQKKPRLYPGNNIEISFSGLWILYFSPKFLTRTCFLSFSIMPLFKNTFYFKWHLWLLKCFKNKNSSDIKIYFYSIKINLHSSKTTLPYIYIYIISNVILPYI